MKKHSIPPARPSSGFTATSASIPSAPQAARIEALRARLAAGGLDAILLSLPSNRFYYTGFASTFGIVVIDLESATFITDGRYLEMAQKAMPGWQILCIPSTGLDEWHKAFWKRRAYHAVGFEGTAPWSEVEIWKRQARGARFVECEDFVRTLRMSKDAGELAAMHKAARIADKVIADAIANLRPGITELEISRFIRRAIEDITPEGESFPNIVASGPNSSRPHHHPSQRRLRQGDVVILDIGARWKGYCSDITRTVVLGPARRISPRVREVYDAVARAQAAAIAALRPGIRALDVDAAARQSLELEGLAEFFVHGLGHGVGIEIHEAPRLNPRATETLAESMAITIEPGVYLPGEFGVRIEDFVRVGARSPILISRAPKPFTILG